MSTEQELGLLKCLLLRRFMSNFNFLQPCRTAFVISAGCDCRAQRAKLARRIEWLRREAPRVSMETTQAVSSFTRARCALKVHDSLYNLIMKETYLPIC